MTRRHNIKVVSVLFQQDAETPDWARTIQYRHKRCCYFTDRDVSPQDLLVVCVDGVYRFVIVQEVLDITDLTKASRGATKWIVDKVDTTAYKISQNRMAEILLEQRDRKRRVQELEQALRDREHQVRQAALDVLVQKDPEAQALRRSLETAQALLQLDL